MKSFEQTDTTNFEELTIQKWLETLPLTANQQVSISAFLKTHNYSAEELGIPSDEDASSPFTMAWHLKYFSFCLLRNLKLAMEALEIDQKRIEELLDPINKITPTLFEVNTPPPILTSAEPHGDESDAASEVIGGAGAFSDTLSNIDDFGDLGDLNDSSQPTTPTGVLDEFKPPPPASSFSLDQKTKTTLAHIIWIGDPQINQTELTGIKSLTKAKPQQDIILWILDEHASHYREVFKDNPRIIIAPVLNQLQKFNINFGSSPEDSIDKRVARCLDNSKEEQQKGNRLASTQYKIVAVNYVKAIIFLFVGGWIFDSNILHSTVINSLPLLPAENQPIIPQLTTPSQQNSDEKQQVDFWCLYQPMNQIVNFHTELTRDRILSEKFEKPTTHTYMHLAAFDQMIQALYTLFKSDPKNGASISSELTFEEQLVNMSASGMFSIIHEDLQNITQNFNSLITILESFNYEASLDLILIKQSCNWLKKITNQAPHPKQIPSTPLNLNRPSPWLHDYKTVYCFQLFNNQFPSMTCYKKMTGSYQQSKHNLPPQLQYLSIPVDFSNKYHIDNILRALNSVSSNELWQTGISGQLIRENEDGNETEVLTIEPKHNLSALHVALLLNREFYEMILQHIPKADLSKILNVKVIIPQELNSFREIEKESTLLHLADEKFQLKNTLTALDNDYSQLAFNKINFEDYAFQDINLCGTCFREVNLNSADLTGMIINSNTSFIDCETNHLTTCKNFLYQLPNSDQLVKIETQEYIPKAIDKIKQIGQTQPTLFKLNQTTDTNSARQLLSILSALTNLKIDKDSIITDLLNSKQSEEQQAPGYTSTQ